MKNKHGKLSVRGQLVVNAVRLLFLGCLIMTAYGAVKTYFYALPMAESRFEDAYRSPSGDSTLALYAHGVDTFTRYGDTRYSKAVLNKAFNELTRQTGLVPPDRRELASNIQHMIGVLNEEEKQFRLAITAYEESLKANPDNMESKYNLERLKQQYPDLGKKKPDQGGGPKAGNKQKGI